MTTPIHPGKIGRVRSDATRFGRGDPLLQELWAAKAALNAAAGYDVAKLAQQASRFDLDAVLARLRQQINH